MKDTPMPLAEELAKAIRHLEDRTTGAATFEQIMVGRDQLKTLLSALRQEGHVLAPREPTEEMLDAACEVGPDTNSGCFSFDDARQVYAAMLSAVPGGVK